MKILLTGANGFIGHHIKQAFEEEHELITPSHQEADFNTAIKIEDWLPLLKDVDVVINSVGIIAEIKGQSFTRLHSDTPIALFQACAKSDVKRVIQISALGADENAFTPYQTSKLAADNVLKDLSLLSFILRPSLVYGEGGTSLAMFKRLAIFPILSLPDGGKQEIQPVHVSDLVTTIKQCLLAENSQIIDVVGPHAITLAEYIQAIRNSKGKPKAKIISIPMKLVMLSAQLGRYLIPMMHPDNLRMLQQGNTADVAPLIAFIGKPPLAVDEAMK